MNYRKRKKGLMLLATMGVAAVGAIAGYAFFTASGSGPGSVTVGTASSFAVTQLSTSGGPLYPDASVGGANTELVTYGVVNPGGGSEKLHNVVIQIANSTGGAWSTQPISSDPACNATDFSINGLAVNTAATNTNAAVITAGGTYSETATVEMVDNGSTQDNCQGVSVPLYFSAS